MKELAVFHYLTNSQFRALGVSKSERSLNRKLGLLSELGLVRAIRFDGVPRRETFYALTKRGAKLVPDRTGKSLSEIPYTKNTYPFSYDSFHRKLTIDFHIALVKWVRSRDQESSHLPSLTFFDRYFEATGTNRSGDPFRPRLSSKTRVQFGRNKRLYPDVNFLVTSTDQNQLERQSLFTLEVCR